MCAQYESLIFLPIGQLSLSHVHFRQAHIFLALIFGLYDRKGTLGKEQLMRIVHKKKHGLRAFSLPH